MPSDSDRLDWLESLFFQHHGMILCSAPRKYLAWDPTLNMDKAVWQPCVRMAIDDGMAKEKDDA